MAENSKAQDFTCNLCGHHWIGPSARCPNGCVVFAKSGGEFTRKTFQGDDTDLKKGMR
jgi:rubrerythrin